MFGHFSVFKIEMVLTTLQIAGFAGSNELMQNVYTTTQKHPFQMDQLNSVNRSTSGNVVFQGRMNTDSNEV